MVAAIEARRARRLPAFAPGAPGIAVPPLPSPPPSPPTLVAGARRDIELCTNSDGGPGSGVAPTEGKDGEGGAVAGPRSGRAEAEAAEAGENMVGRRAAEVEGEAQGTKAGRDGVCGEGAQAAESEATEPWLALALRAACSSARGVGQKEIKKGILENDHWRKFKCLLLSVACD